MKNRVESVFVDLFTSRHVCYYMSFQEMMKYWNRAKEGGVKHFKYEELEYWFFCSTKAGNDPSLSGMSAKSIKSKKINKIRVENIDEKQNFVII